ncbi:DASH family cryptochrome [Portibacter marinus]|uniref:DASH family cryptochrome n=1 Tax=Portibacter marinus TaxID=2898660 RepID=UPI001F34B109|nr:DASH family cryptochrome [Portibacter marinus]
MKTLLWHRNDLRLLDNETLVQASGPQNLVLPLYIFDPNEYRFLNLGFRKIGIHRFRYLSQTLSILRQNYMDSGGNCMIKVGDPKIIISELVEKFEIEQVLVQKELASEEIIAENQVEEALNEWRIPLHRIWGRTLYHIDDIPYEKQTIPLTSKTFRINTSKYTEPRPIFSRPDHIHFIQAGDWGNLPDAMEVGFTKEEIKEGVQEIYPAGEQAALERLEYYTFESELLTTYKWTRNRSLGLDYSSKFSPFLAVGAISPRVIYWKIKEYEAQIKKNISTWWLVFELVWRDYFCFAAWRHGNAMFHDGGIKKRDVEWNNDQDLFKRWKEGKTGIPFLDAHLKELNQTGFMSNRGRVNAASFLSRDYKVDWRWGAAWFENRLIDYDVYSNWMNWNMQAMEIWYTNPVHQAMKYDKNGEYTLKWNPKLSVLPAPTFHAPWKYSAAELKDYGIADYQKPVEIYKKWSRAVNKIWEGKEKVE